MSDKVLVVNSYVSEEIVEKMRRYFPNIVRVHSLDCVPADRAFVVDPDALTTQDLRTGEVRKPFAL